MNIKQPCLLCLMSEVENQSTLIEAFTSVRLTSKLHFVETPEQLLEFLEGQGQYHNRTRYPLPNVLLLAMELSDPETFPLLQELKEEHPVSMLPIIIISKEIDNQLLFQAYSNGVTSIIQNTTRFDSLVNILKVLDDYWCDVVKLPKID